MGGFFFERVYNNRKSLKSKLIKNQSVLRWFAQSPETDTQITNLVRHNAIAQVAKKGLFGFVYT